MKQLITRVDDDLHARFKGWCEDSEISMQAAIKGFMSSCIATGISEPKFSKGFLRLFPFKPHEVLLKNDMEPQKFLRMLEVLEANFKNTYKKPSNKGFYDFLMRLLRIFVAKKL